MISGQRKENKLRENKPVGMTKGNALGAGKRAHWLNFICLLSLPGFDPARMSI